VVRGPGHLLYSIDKDQKQTLIKSSIPRTSREALGPLFPGVISKREHPVFFTGGVMRCSSSRGKMSVWI